MLHHVMNPYICLTHPPNLTDSCNFFFKPHNMTRVINRDYNDRIQDN
jgi:hypothetical protein